MVNNSRLQQNLIYLSSILFEIHLHGLLLREEIIYLYGHRMDNVWFFLLPETIFDDKAKAQPAIAAN